MRSATAAMTRKRRWASSPCCCTRRASSAANFHVPFWVVIACQVAMAAGTLAGGWRIVKTMGSKITRLTPMQGCLRGDRRFDHVVRGDLARHSGVDHAHHHRLRSSASARRRRCRRCAGAWPRKSSPPGSSRSRRRRLIAALFYWIVGLRRALDRDLGRGSPRLRCAIRPAASSTASRRGQHGLRRLPGRRLRAPARHRRARRRPSWRLPPRWRRCAKSRRSRRSVPEPTTETADVKLSISCMRLGDAADRLDRAARSRPAPR